jgi:hypothetical protein
MSMHKVTVTQITGITTLSYNTVDLDSFVSVPSGATAVLLAVQNTINGGRALGFRTTGKTGKILDEATGLVLALGAAHHVVPLGTGNQIDIYVGASGVNFYIVGFFSSAWTFFDIDGTAVNLPSSGGTLSTVTAPTDVPVSSTIMLLESLANTWRPTGQTSSISHTGQFMLLPLNSSRQVDVNSSATKRILGYCSTGVTWQTWLPADESGAFDGTYYDGTSTSSGKAFAYVHAGGFASSEGFIVREKGTSDFSTIPSNIGQFANTTTGAWYAPLDSSGVYQWAAENAVTGNPKVLAFFDNATVPSTSTPYVTVSAQRNYRHSGRFR